MKLETTVASRLAADLQAFDLRRAANAFSALRTRIGDCSASSSRVKGRIWPEDVAKVFRSEHLLEHGDLIATFALDGADAKAVAQR
jgi:hypothetical protein